MTTEHNMDSFADRISVIENLTIDTLREISFMQMLEILRPLVLVEVPENGDIESRARYDYLLARCANLNAYLRYLFAFASYERDRLRSINSPKANDMLKKKEALYELKEAMKAKYDAVSRKITLALEDEEQVPDRASYTARREARDTKSNAAAKPTTAAPSTGGWNRVP